MKQSWRNGEHCWPPRCQNSGVLGVKLAHCVFLALRMSKQCPLAMFQSVPVLRFPPNCWSKINTSSKRHLQKNHSVWGFTSKPKRWVYACPLKSYFPCLLLLFSAANCGCLLPVSQQWLSELMMPFAVRPWPFAPFELSSVRGRGKSRKEMGRKTGLGKGTEGGFGPVPLKCLIVFIDDRPTCSLDTHFLSQDMSRINK